MRIKTRNEILKSLREVGSRATFTRNHLLNKGKFKMTYSFENNVGKLVSRLGSYSPLLNILATSSRQKEKRFSYNNVEYEVDVTKIDSSLYDVYVESLDNLKEEYFDNNEVIEFTEETVDTLTPEKLEKYKQVMMYLNSELFEYINKR